MKVAPLITVALILCIAFPGPIQAKKKFCMGKNGNKYAVGNGYDDKEGEVCIRYKCVKKKKKVIMKEMKCNLSCTSTQSTLSSNGFKYHKTKLKNDITKMEVVQKISKSSCIQGFSFGFKGPEAWVDKGCRAKFRFSFCKSEIGTTLKPVTCPPVPTCPTVTTCPDKTCPSIPSCPTFPPKTTCPTCPATPTCPTLPEQTTCPEKTFPPIPTCPTNGAISTTTAKNIDETTTTTDFATPTGTFPDGKCFQEETNITFHDIGQNQYGQSTLPDWKITEGGQILVQMQNTRPSIGVSDLGDPSLPVSYKGRIYSEISDSDVIGMVFGYQDKKNFFVVASSSTNRPGPINWYVGRVHATCGASCHTTRDISAAIGNPSAHPTDITVLKTGTDFRFGYFWFSICFNPYKLLMDITITNETHRNATVLETGTISCATGKTTVDDMSRGGGSIGVYVDSQRGTTWEKLECSGCTI